MWCLARVALPGNRVSVGSLVVVVRLFGMAMRDPRLMTLDFGYGVRPAGESGVCRVRFEASTVLHLLVLPALERGGGRFRMEGEIWGGFGGWRGWVGVPGKGEIGPEKPGEMGKQWVKNPAWVRVVGLCFVGDWLGSFRGIHFFEILRGGWGGFWAWWGGGIGGFWGGDSLERLHWLFPALGEHEGCSGGGCRGT